MYYFKYKDKNVELSEEEVNFIMESLNFLDKTIEHGSLQIMAIGNKNAQDYLLLYDDQFVEYINDSFFGKSLIISISDFKQIKNGLEIVKTIASVMLLNGKQSKEISDIFKRNIELANKINNKIDKLLFELDTADGILENENDKKK